MFFQAIEASLRLFELTGNEKYKNEAYTYAQKSKASLLREEILQNKAFAAILPDSIRYKKQDIETNIYSYKKLIFDQNQEQKPDKEKIDKWSHNLFKLNNEYEDLITKIRENYSDYERLTSKTEIISLENLQKRLKKDETLVEYSLSPLSEVGNRKLFIFVVTKDQLNYFKNELDSSFTTDINQVREQMNKHETYASNLQEYNKLNNQLHHLYLELIQPVEKYFRGKNIFVIPDEEIAYLSFDALQKQYSEQNSINYAAIPYLIYDYCFSYAYASSLLFQDVPEKYKKEFVYAFAPNYSGEIISSTRFQFGKLENTEKEIKSILSWFDGKALAGREANEEFFKTISDQGGIFHFAMHASAEKDNPDFSFLAITQEDENEEDGMFYNYEIAMMNMKATMVVLSGCNTGDGVISSGEGVMSLTRNFILAGVPSIVHSLWEVQDETSVVIMDKFYKYLSEGFQKMKPYDRRNSIILRVLVRQW
ncbi:MAG: CHAT domain-containing protein [Chloroflexia bacterium]|nr:CHAT domain-containing protein [Chloroflexia bacterium]